MGIAKQFFRAAVRRRMLTENPFDGQAVSARANPLRAAFVSRADAEAILAALPDAKWRLAFGLARYGGLRTPSEIVGLRWADVSWSRMRFTVHATKTEHHAAGGVRVVPLFRELAPLFREAFESAPAGEIFCCPQYPGRFAGQMYRKIVLAAMMRAGVKPWPKLFQNCRASRETELAESYPVQVVCSWIGNSPAVAAKHYLQTTEAHYRQATGGAESGAESGAAGVGNAAQRREGPDKKCKPVCKNAQSCAEICISSTPDRSRTCNLWLRRPSLYPVELRAYVSAYLLKRPGRRARRKNQFTRSGSHCQESPRPHPGSAPGPGIQNRRKNGPSRLARFTV